MKGDYQLLQMYLQLMGYAFKDTCTRYQMINLDLSDYSDCRRIFGMLL